MAKVLYASAIFKTVDHNSLPPNNVFSSQEGGTLAPPCPLGNTPMDTSLCSQPSWCQPGILGAQAPLGIARVKKKG